MSKIATSPDLVRRGFAVLVFAEEVVIDEPHIETPSPTEQAKRNTARIIDPYYALAQFGTVWVNLKSNPDAKVERIDLEYKNADELLDLLETLYVIHGWHAVDSVIEGVQRSLIASIVDIFKLPNSELEAIQFLVGSREGRMIYAPPDHVGLVGDAIGALLVLAQQRHWPDVIDGLEAVVPVNGLFSPGTAHAYTQAGIAENSEVAARLYAIVLVALNKARLTLKGYVLTAMIRMEREAFRLMSSMLMDARATICRETIRYFAFADEGSVDAALRTLHDRPVASQTKSKKDKSQAVTHPEALQEALKRLVPFAREVIRIDSSPRRGPTITRIVETALIHKQTIFGREVGRYAQVFPVLSQIEVKDVEPASLADVTLLGEIVFTLLRRAYHANIAMHARVKQLSILSDNDVVRDNRHPQQALVNLIHNIGKSETVWGYTKYIERALNRLAGPEDDFTRKAVEDVLGIVGAESTKVAATIGQAAGEMTALHLTSSFARRLVPALNIALAAWHISTAVKEFTQQHEEFYCSLDPSDAFVEAAPSTVGLALDVLSETVFAFI